MSIDFHAAGNKNTYAGRDAQPDWTRAITGIVDPRGKRVVDVGCGGGIYSQAWADLGAQRVTGVDFSQVMVDTATANAAGRGNIAFQVGAAHATGLPAGSADVVFERALIHHLKDYGDCFAEARRMLPAGGVLVVQDRTPEDTRLPGSEQHIRGYFFECFPRLLAFESGRRPADDRVRAALEGAGFGSIATYTLWETRTTHAGIEALARDIKGRTGRSILHELTDEELDRLVAYIAARVPAKGPITEKDRWTIWSATAI
jgi:ubiquinone/menaquinone biosynthesis C-methylase UbiE